MGDFTDFQRFIPDRMHKLQVRLKGWWKMRQVYEKLVNCVDQVRRRTDFVPRAAIVLGSGLGDYAEDIRML